MTGIDYIPKHHSFDELLTNVGLRKRFVRDMSEYMEVDFDELETAFESVSIYYGYLSEKD